MVKFRNLISGFVTASVLASSFLIVVPANARIVRLPPGAMHPGPNFPGNGGQFGGMHNPGMGGSDCCCCDRRSCCWRYRCLCCLSSG